ncbi:hypothetical protein THAOC_33167 [Thalassiosira oceanica]|uniref:Uncharacterized protein n=1 Tax=Thalassiosira oceanica TaxID=159749 RepID=K0RMU7_THAOC|nr:hypothetical protein THAOC_33167 [Thalassiosira oceanica]|eukprot:EJK48067.1 hypothetical protein THAOC_33167 [Thalassiosira oceanica]
MSQASRVSERDGSFGEEPLGGVLYGLIGRRRGFGTTGAEPDAEGRRNTGRIGTGRFWSAAKKGSHHCTPKQHSLRRKQWDPLLTYTLAPMHLSAFHISRGSGKTAWEPTFSSTPTAIPYSRGEISLFNQPGTPQIGRVYGSMDPLLTYTLAPMHLSAFHISRGSGKTAWEPTSSSTPTAIPYSRA